MKLKYDMTIVNLGGERTAVPLDTIEEFRGVLQMNGTAARIIELLFSDTTEDTIITALLEEYDAPRERVQASVSKVLEILRREGLLTE